MYIVGGCCLTVYFSPSYCSLLLSITSLERQSVVVVSKTKDKEEEAEQPQMRTYRAAHSAWPNRAMH